MRLLEEEARRGRRGGAEQDGLRLMPAALYAGLPAAAQLAALEPPPRGYRKVGVRPPASERKLCLAVCMSPRPPDRFHRARALQPVSAFTCLPQ